MRQLLEVVTCCVGYGDFLREAVEQNRPLLDRWLIVTADRDEETREFCRSHGLECLVTDDFYRSGADFDKSRAIDRGLQLLSHRGWVLHLDADIVLPPHFRESLEDADLDERVLYGADRFSVRGWEKWQRLKASGFLRQHSRGAHHYVAFPEGFPVGARWADTSQGYCPIGAFQLWHGPSSTWKGIRTRRYPAHGHADAARCDIQFALLWDRRHRQILPEVVVAHLESEAAAIGANWSGRTTKRFGPPVSPRAAAQAGTPS